MKYLCTFERIGRNHGVPPTEFDAGDEGGLAHLVYGFAGRYLASREYSVIVSLDPETDRGEGSIDGGRFGKFTVEPA